MTKNDYFAHILLFCIRDLLFKKNKILYPIGTNHSFYEPCYLIILQLKKRLDPLSILTRIYRKYINIF